MNRLTRLLFVFLAGVLLSQCGPSDAVDDPVVVRVFDKELRTSEVQNQIRSELSMEDSARVAETYIDQWIRQAVLLSRAEYNLPAEKLDVQKQLENYRRSLIVYAYERELVRQKLDTNVSNSEIEQYYNENQNNFELKDYIVKVFYIKLKKNSPQLPKAKRWMVQFNEKAVGQLEDYAYQFAVNYFIDSDVWLYYDDLLKEIPIGNFTTEQLIRRKDVVELEDEEHLYLMRFLDFRLKNSNSPLALERENIKNILLNQRKVELINRMKKDIYEEALNNGDIERY